LQKSSQNFFPLKNKNRSAHELMASIEEIMADSDEPYQDNYKDLIND
jgi:hypothetical protein